MEHERRCLTCPEVQSVSTSSGQQLTDINVDDNCSGRSESSLYPADPHKRTAQTGKAGRRQVCPALERGNVEGLQDSAEHNRRERFRLRAASRLQRTQKSFMPNFWHKCLLHFMQTDPVRARDDLSGPMHLCYFRDQRGVTQHPALHGRRHNLPSECTRNRLLSHQSCPVAEGFLGSIVIFLRGLQSRSLLLAGGKHWPEFCKMPVEGPVYLTLPNLSHIGHTTCPAWASLLSRGWQVCDLLDISGSLSQQGNQEACNFEP